MSVVIVLDLLNLPTSNHPTRLKCSLYFTANDYAVHSVPDVKFQCGPDDAKILLNGRDSAPGLTSSLIDEMILAAVKFSRPSLPIPLAHVKRYYPLGRSQITVQVPRIRRKKQSRTVNYDFRSSGSFGEMLK